MRDSGYESRLWLLDNVGGRENGCFEKFGDAVLSARCCIIRRVARLEKGHLVQGCQAIDEGRQTDRILSVDDRGRAGIIVAVVVEEQTIDSDRTLLRLSFHFRIHVVIHDKDCWLLIHRIVHARDWRRGGYRAHLLEGSIADTNRIERTLMHGRGIFHGWNDDGARRGIGNGRSREDSR